MVDAHLPSRIAPILPSATSVTAVPSSFIWPSITSVILVIFSGAISAPSYEAPVWIQVVITGVVGVNVTQYPVTFSRFFIAGCKLFIWNTTVSC